MKISVNLMHYFHDHRQLAKIYIKENFETIRDVENHIAKTFTIKSTFYLRVDNHLLPSDEDVRLLSDGDFVFVEPILDSKGQNNIEHKCAINSPKITSDIAQNCDETSAEKTCKKLKTKKKKKRDKIKNKEDSNKELLTVIPEDTNRSYELHEKDQQLNEIESNFKMNPKKRRRCISSSKEDDNLKNISSFLPDNCEKEEGCFKNNCETPMEQDNTSIVKKIEMVSINPVELISTVQNQNEADRKFLSLNDTLNFNKKSPTSLNNTIDKELSNFNKICVDSCNNVSPSCNDENTSQASLNMSIPEEGKVSTRALRKICSGIGNFITQLSNSDSVENTEASCNFITRRKRLRTRKRRTRNLDNSDIESVSSNMEPCVFVPPNTKAAPKSHIKFATNDEIENLAHSTPLNKMKNANNKLSINDFNIENLPSMKEMPEIDSLILFKTLKLDENYCPIVTNYVLGEVQCNWDQNIKIKILDGKDQLKEPTGKFSIIPEDEEYVPNNVVILKIDELIEAKIVL